MVVKWSWIYGLWRMMLIDIIGWSLKMIEVYMESNRKEMDYGVKEDKKVWEIATFLLVDKREYLRNLSILSYLFMHYMIWNDIYWLIFIPRLRKHTLRARRLDFESIKSCLSP